VFYTGGLQDLNPERVENLPSVASEPRWPPKSEAWSLMDLRVVLVVMVLLHGAVMGRP
jgi:hypothetical protein